MLENHTSNASQQGESFSLPKPGVEDKDLGILEANLDLAGEVSLIQQQWMHGDKGEWYLLPNTGFNVQWQINRLRKNFQEGLASGKSFDAIVADSNSQVGEDIYGFSEEYLKGKALLPFLHEIKQVDGVSRMVSPRYGDAVLVDLLSDQERDGAVKKAFVGDKEKKKLGIEEFFKYAPTNSIVLRSSPPKWSGFEGVEYVDTQTQIMQKVVEDGRILIKGYTIVTTMDLAQNEALLASLGTPVDINAHLKSERQRIVDVTGESVFLLPEWGMGVKEVLSHIEKIAGSKANKGYPFYKLYGDVDRFSELLQIDTLSEQQINQFTMFCTNELLKAKKTIEEREDLPVELIKKLQIALGLSVLKLSKLRREENSPKPTQSRVHLYQGKAASFDLRYQVMIDGYKEELEDVKKMTGCNGGNNSLDSNTKTVKTAFGSRTIRTTNTENLSQEDPFSNCAVCSRSKADNHYHCPDCETTYADETSKAAGERTKQCNCGFKFNC